MKILFFSENRNAKKAVLFPILMLFFCQAFPQVTIGSGTPPHDGAALELVSENMRGLLLPRVNLTLATSWPPLTGSPVNGMIVYNTNDVSTPESGLDGLGVYVWITDKWNVLRFNEEEPCVVPDQPGNITITPGVKEVETSFGVSVPAVPNATHYIWEYPSGISGPTITTANQIAVMPFAAKTFPVGSIKVRAMNDCGLSPVRASTMSITVNIGGNYCPKPDTPSEIVFSTVNVTKGDTFVAAVTNVSGLSYVWQLPAGLYGSSTINNIRITGVMSGVYGAGSITVYAVNSCGRSASRSSTKAVSVTRTSYCPRGGFVVDNGVFTGPADYAGTSQSVIGAFTRVQGSRLCLYPLDGHFGQNWATVAGGCTSGAYAPDNEGYGVNWRLPNIAEVDNMLTPTTYAAYGMTAFIAGGSSSYWSATTSGNDHAFAAGLNSDGKSKFIPQKIPKVNTTRQAVRCVKTL